LAAVSERCAIALGSNLGDSKALLESALVALDRTLGITLEKCSSWYKTIAIGPPQPDYLNGCALLTVQLAPEALLATLLQIETQFGRVRQQHWGPRTLDLDLLLYGRTILELPHLQLPHPRMTKRAFVLVPLAEIAPHWIEPISEKTIQALVQAVDCSGVQKLQG